MARHNSSPAVLELPTGQKTILECFDDGVLILPDKRDEKTAGGIVLPDNARSQESELRYGKVVAVGPGKMSDNGLRIAPDVEVGDRVVYTHAIYGGGTIEHEGKKYDLLAASGVYLRLKPV